MTYIALLRGINVGGHKKFPKADQLTMALQLGFEDPQLYLHTGNWVFSSEESVGVISKKISAAIKKQYDWEVPVMVLKASELKQIFEACPFAEEIKKKSYFIVLNTAPTTERITELKKYAYPGEVYHLSNSWVYFYPAIGAGKAKMGNNFFENKLKVTATSRNYRTMAKLISMVEGK